MTKVTIQQEQIFVVRTNNDPDIEIYCSPEEVRISLTVMKEYEENIKVTGEEILGDVGAPNDVSARIFLGQLLIRTMKNWLRNQADEKPAPVDGPKITPTLCFVYQDEKGTCMPCFSVAALAEQLGVDPKVAGEKDPNPDNKNAILLQMYTGVHSFVKPPKTSWLDEAFSHFFDSSLKDKK